MYPRTGNWVGSETGLEVCGEEKISCVLQGSNPGPSNSYPGPEWKEIETKFYIKKQYYFPFENIQFVHFLFHLVWKTINIKLRFEKKTQFLEEYFYRLLSIPQVFAYGAGLNDIGLASTWQ